MRLNDIMRQIGDQQHPPVERWNPEFCGDLDMEIRRNGEWYYQGSPIGRPAMVKLFSSILKREDDRYYLVTPVEKVGIRVEATPFIATQADWVDGTWIVTDKLGEQQPLDREHPLDARTDPEMPIMLWRRNLPARIHQNLMYQWQNWALENEGLDDNGDLWLESAGERFWLANTKA